MTGLKIKKNTKCFLNCYFNDQNTNNLFFEITSDQNTDFSRYYYFYASHMASKGDRKCNQDYKKALKLYPRNLLLNQFKIDLNKLNKELVFDCKKKSMSSLKFYISPLMLCPLSLYILNQIFI